MNVFGAVIHGTDLAILVYFLALNSFYALLLVLSIPEIWEQTRLAEDDDFQRLMQSDALPPITLLVPAYNESATIEASVTAMLTLEYRSYEVVVVNDGSKDETIERLRHAFDLYEIPRIYPETIPTKPLRAVYRSRTRSRLLVLDKENGGKADSLNAAINASRFPLVMAVDADTLIEPDALLRLTRPFLLGREVAAVGGTVRVANNCTVKDGRVTDARVPRRLLPGIQVVEYLRAFLFGRLGWNRLGGNLIISGAFGLFRKEYVAAIGGYRTTSIVEDLDLVVRLHRHLRGLKVRYEMPFIPDPVAWTEVPESAKILARQRERWHRGLIAATWQYKGMMFNPRYGPVGFLAMPFYTFGEMLAPLIELFGWVVTVGGLATGLVDTSFALLFVLVAWGYGMLLSIWAVVLEEVSFRRYRRFGDLLLLLLYASLENFGYRQRTVWWRLKAFVSVWKSGHVWGDMIRKGFTTTTVITLCVVTALGAQTRAGAWASYDAVDGSNDWHTLGAQVTWRGKRGDAFWFAAEAVTRFGTNDGTERVGGVFHPTPRWWFTVEAGTSVGPEVVPKNSWEADVTARATRTTALGVAYRRLNYVVGPVDVVIPHAGLQSGSTAWEARAFVSRNPSDRTDVAAFLRVTTTLSSRAAGWIGAGAGRESYLVGAPPTQQVQAIETMTGAAGVRYNAGRGLALRLDATVVHSKTILSRWGVGFGLEQTL
ncbi:MAG TPA: glycosyltransferase [Gemmatimonadales bacterium]|jgi:YaiO family outer membrane protein|nr:glycosyltransferase [Gemmatimonadales bacterium]